MVKYLPGFETSYIESTCHVGIRETRRIKAAYYLTIDDFKHARKFEDAIMQAKWGHCDIHSGKDMRWQFEIVEGPYQVPYRCLVPVNVENLIVGGRCIWTDRAVNGTLRCQPECMATGQGAGIGAAIAVRKRITPREK